jgi:autotransporter-associated beta strand protein
MKGTNIQITAAFLSGLAFLGAASANAQEVTWLRNVEVNQTVSDRGQSVSLLDMANSGMGSITDVNVNLSLSSLNQNNPMWLGQVYASLTYGVASEGVRTAVLLNRPGVSDSNAFGSSLSSLNVTFDDSAETNIFDVASGTGTYRPDGRLGVNPYGSGVIYTPANLNTTGLSALNGSLLQNQQLSLLVADTQQGAVAKLDSWGVKITGTAASSGLLNPGAGGSVRATGATQSVTATVVSSSTGSGAVGLLAMVNQELNLSRGLKGSGEFNKTGSGTVRVGDSTEFTGTLNVNEGKLVVDGALASGSTTVVGNGGLLGGSGKVGAISGAGTVGPGNSPGILTATSVNPTAGTDFKFEFTALNPTYTSATASGNDLLHLTASASPFAGGTFTSGNIISIYLNSSTINDSLLAGQNTTFSGGFFVDGSYELAAALSPASFAYYTTSAALGTGAAVDYSGVSYYLLDSAIAAKTTLSNTAVTGAGFATGTVSGTLLTFNAVPEPSSQSLLAFGMIALVALRSMRRKQS